MTPSDIETIQRQTRTLLFKPQSGGEFFGKFAPADWTMRLLDAILILEQQVTTLRAEVDTLKSTRPTTITLTEDQAKLRGE